ncbi:SufD family Fe-S cluster assembly protein, partial [Klebsiella pneumoniae]|uniref:SufD family Fe-S cluster assembly protein n=1 Tax=Klebsiella pneumoniae TaxID=573 RepID=UPI0029390352
QTETEATGAPQKHHYTLNQQVGSITEIYADDVKCSHGATVGRIDEEQLFYLRSRGIEQQAAQQMILYAFAAELTEAIRSDALREQVLARIGQRLPGGTV